MLWSMRRLLLAALLVAPECDEDDGPEPLTVEDDPLCTTAAIMDDELCPDWREQSRDYGAGCWAAAWTVMEERHGEQLDLHTFSDWRPAPDECLEE